MLLLGLFAIIVLMGWLGTIVLFRLPRPMCLGVVIGLWLLYAGYEYLMFHRVLCTGDCNIRVDLLLIYPLLLLATLAALTRVVRAKSGR